MGKKCLPVTEPDITSNPYVTNKLAIMSAYEEAKPWIIQSFTNFWVKKVFKANYWADFLYSSSYRFCPYFMEFQMSKSVTDIKWKIPSELMIDMINIGLYSYLNVNIAYITEYKHFKENQMHDIMVYGYDEDEKVLYVADFFVNGKYSMKKVPFDEFNAAYSHIGETEEKDFFPGISCAQYKALKLPFDLKVCIQGISDYVNSKNTVVKSILEEFDNQEDVVYGISCYDAFIQYLQTIPDMEAELDYRTFHYFYQHKVLMRIRLEFLMQKGYLSEDADSNILNEYKEIEIKWLEIRNRILKYNVKPDENLITRSINDIRNFKNREMKILEHLIKEINL